ncbi:hypothetical protein ACQ4M3_39755 [Leptolyngbya sp. AN03gr2]|uniref:hypothetical protein n=1 Tax=unclassified Leptolyngbya TaxID=2650499 RepID=UPI003D314CBF
MSSPTTSKTVHASFSKWIIHLESIRDRAPMPAALRDRTKASGKHHFTMTQDLITERPTRTTYGTLCFQAYSFNPTCNRVRIAGDFIGEWAGDDAIDEVWEELNPWSWEDPDEFPTTQQEWSEYLEFCAADLVRRFEAQITAARSPLQTLTQQWFDRHRSAPSPEWLLDRFPKLHFTRADQQFKQRVVTIVLSYFEQQSQQLRLF